jgi:AcrR family transcriptional regulator
VSPETQGPTGATRRRVRLDHAETGRRMLDAALAMIAERGFTVSLEHLSLEEVIAAAGVARSSAYRRWPYKDLFFSDLLVEVARSTDLVERSWELVRAALQRLAAGVAELRTPAGRRDLVVATLRTYVQADIEAIASSHRWRTYLALNATFMGLPDGHLRRTVSEAVADTDRSFTEERAALFAEVSTLLGYRLAPPLTGPAGYRVMATATGAVMTGLHIKALTHPGLVTESQPLRAFGSTREESWSVPALVTVGTILSYIAPDPALAWDRARIAAVTNALSERLRTPSPVAATLTRPVTPPSR